jgi:membrane protease YdiL (CAAX protease family)
MTAPATGVRLTSRDWRLLTIAALVAAGSLWVAAHYFRRAFPESSIDLRVSATGSTPIAEAFLQARGLSTAGDLHAEQFGYDDNARTFLERELGLPKTEALLRSRIHLWRWQHRWFRPLTKEEFDVAVSPAGSVVGFTHALADEAAGASPTEDQARQRAEAFLTSVMHLDLAALEPVETERHQRPHRTDYVFTWKDTAPLVAGATGYLAQAEYRRQVSVAGDQVASYREYLKIPDQWTRDFAQLRSTNDTASEVDAGLLMVLVLGMLIVLAQRIGSGDIRWRTAVWVGGTGAVLSLLATLNALPAARFTYDTTQSYTAFLVGNLFSAVASALGVGVVLALLTGVAESLYRERFARQIALSSWLTRRGVRSRGFLISVALGLALAAFFFAYQTVFYLVANHFGAWAPSDINYDDLLNTKFPWAFVLFGGFFPAISEEFGFRMLAIPLFEKWFRLLWVAVIAASFLWGFGHAAYPNEPWFIRGVEVGTGGVLLSWIMIRYGILTTVVWHYTVDAIYTALLLLRAHDTYLRLSGGLTAFIAIVPLLIAVAAYVRHGGFAPDADLTNAAAGRAVPQEAPAPAEAAVDVPSYRAVTRRAWSTGVLVAVVLLAAYAIPIARWTTALPWHVRRAEAESAARQFLQAQGVALEGYRVVTQTGTPDQLGGGLGEENTVAAASIFAARGRPALVAAFSGPPPSVPAYYWRIRFFKPLQEDEYGVAVRPDSGQISGYVHTLPETAPGASPPLADAQRIATAFLASQGVDVAAMDLKVAEQQKRPARTDSDFVWEAVSGSPLPAKVAYRVEAQLAGDRISAFRSWYHVPERAVRDFERGTAATTLLAILRYLTYALGLGLVSWTFLAFARRSRGQWRRYVWLSAAAGGVMVITAVDGAPTLIASYQTSVPWSLWLVIMAVGTVISGIAGFVITIGLAAPLGFTAPGQIAALTHRTARREWAIDALGAGILAALWTLGWSRAQTVIAAFFHGAGQPPMPAAPAAYGNLIPGLADVLGSPLHGLWYACAAGILLPVLYRLWTSPPARGKALVGGALVLLWIQGIAGVHTAGQFLEAAVLSAAALALYLGFAIMFVRNNPLAYLSAALVPAVAAAGLAWFGGGGGPTRLYAVAVGVVLFAGAAGWLVWLAAQRRRPSSH